MKHRHCCVWFPIGFRPFSATFCGFTTGIIQFYQPCICAKPEFCARHTVQTGHYDGGIFDTWIAKGWGRYIRNDHMGKLIRHTAFFPVGWTIPDIRSAGSAPFPDSGSLGVKIQANQGKQSDDAEGAFHIVLLWTCCLMVQRSGHRRISISVETPERKKQGFLPDRCAISLFWRTHNVIQSSVLQMPRMPYRA